MFVWMCIISVGFSVSVTLTRHAPDLDSSVSSVCLDRDEQSLVRVTVEDRIVRSLGEPFRLDIGTQDHHSRGVHLDLDFRLGAQYSVVDFFVEVLKSKVKSVVVNC